MAQVIFITGTSTGFGKLTAQTLAKAGNTVIAGMRGVNGKNAAVAVEMAKIPNITVVDIDITDDLSVKNAFEEVLGKFGRIDVLVNNAAVSGFEMNPQTIADGILELVKMKAGTRPLRFPLDAIAQGTDKEFIKARADINAKWLAAYSN